MAWDGDEPVGHAHIAWHDTKLGVPEVQDVFVRRDRRRRGVASELTRAAEGLATERGYEHISLSHDTGNEPARRLYEKLGYTRADIPSERVRGTIVIRGEPVEVDDTLVYLVRDLRVD